MYNVPTVRVGCTQRAVIQIVENIKEKETGNNLNFDSKEVLLSRSPEVQMAPETFH